MESAPEPQDRDPPLSAAEQAQAQVDLIASQGMLRDLRDEAKDAEDPETRRKATLALRILGMLERDLETPEG